ncbi:unnamed protein product, partial [Ectocarpus sp. 13 AM-2016]
LRLGRGLWKSQLDLLRHGKNAKKYTPRAFFSTACSERQPHHFRVVKHIQQRTYAKTIKSTHFEAQHSYLNTFYNTPLSNMRRSFSVGFLLYATEAQINTIFLRVHPRPP